MWYDVREGIKSADETSSVVGLQRVLVLKRLESSPVAFLITLLRLAVLHAHRLQQLLNLCLEVGDRDRSRALEAELKALLDKQSDDALDKIRSLATDDNITDPRVDCIKALSQAYTEAKPAADTDDSPPQLSLFSESDAGSPKREQLDRLWALREALLDDLATLFEVTPDLADIIFGRFARAEWPRRFIAGGEEVDWPRSAAWGLRLITDAKLRCLVGRLVQARRGGQKAIVFSQFSDTIAYIQSVLRACQAFSRSEWQMVLRGGLDGQHLRQEEITALLASTATITGSTEERDEVVNTFSPFYRIGPHRPVIERVGEALLSLLSSRGALSELRLEHPSVPFVGIIDLVRLGEDGVSLVDFKTGEPKSAHRQQLTLYAVLWWRRTGQVPAAIEARYPSHMATFSVRTDDLHIAEEGLRSRIDELTGLLENPPAVPRPGDQCRYCDVRQFCNAYWENGLKELPTSQTKQNEQKSIDIELTVRGQPAATGFEAQSRSGRLFTVVHSADGWKVHGPFIDGESLRILNTRLAENGDILELMPWTEVFHR
jgi:hypothetical protein